MGNVRLVGGFVVDAREVVLVARRRSLHGARARLVRYAERTPARYDERWRRAQRAGRSFAVWTLAGCLSPKRRRRRASPHRLTSAAGRSSAAGSVRGKFRSEERSAPSFSDRTVAHRSCESRATSLARGFPRPRSHSWHSSSHATAREPAAAAERLPHTSGRQKARTAWRRASESHLPPTQAPLSCLRRRVLGGAVPGPLALATSLLHVAYDG